MGASLGVSLGTSLGTSLGASGVASLSPCEVSHVVMYYCMHFQCHVETKHFVKIEKIVFQTSSAGLTQVHS